LIFILVFMNL